MPRNAVLELDQVRVDLSLGRLAYRDGQQGALTTRERELLLYLVERQGEIVEREDLERHVFGMGPTVLSRAVDITVARLRQKLEPDRRRPVHLQTVHGSGYRWTALDGSDCVIAHAPQSSMPRLQLGSRIVDLERGIILHEGECLPLTATERHLLKRLVEEPGGLPPDDLVPPRARCAQTPARVAKAVHRLRAKLEDDPSSPRYLVRVPGGGYRMDLQPQSPVLCARLSKVVWAAVRHLGQSLGLQDCVLYWRTGDRLQQVAAFGPKNPEGEQIINPLVLPLDRGVVGASATANTALRIADTRWDNRYIADDGSGRSELAVPIRLKDRVIGIIDSEHPLPNAYRQAHQRSFESLSEVVSSAAAF